MLKDCGITPSTRILVLGGHSAAQRAELAAQDAAARARDERQERLNRLRHAAEALAKRSGTGWAPAQCSLPPACRNTPHSSVHPLPPDTRMDCV